MFSPSPLPPTSAEDVGEGVRFSYLRVDNG